MPARSELADAVDALLPQTQCTKCGYRGCRPYAEAMARGEANINQCPPGGAAGIAKLAALLGRAPLPLNPANGAEKPLQVARIDESLCIGCTLCIAACPVDAIVGAAKLMHTVIAPLCTGCDLCVAPCPMDCIAMVATHPPRRWMAADAGAARARFDARLGRLTRAQARKDERLATRTLAQPDEVATWDDATPREISQKRATVAAAIERARAARAARVAQARRDGASQAPIMGGQARAAAVQTCTLKEPACAPSCSVRPPRDGDDR